MTTHRDRFDVLSCGQAFTVRTEDDAIYIRKFGSDEEYRMSYATVHQFAARGAARRAMLADAKAAKEGR